MSAHVTQSVQSEAPAAPEPKRSAVEVVKENSQALRGTLIEELAKDSDKFSDADKNLLKFHGSYQQEDRDARKNRRADGQGKFHIFMIRCKIPGGRLTAEQYLGVDALSGQHANGTLRFTTRQGIQLHGVIKRNMKATIAGINATLLTTLGACGDVNRNVMSCPAPLRGVRDEMQDAARRLAAHFAPRSNAYHEVWLDGEPVENPGAREEPIYGKVYLPRKFKIGFGLPEDNCVDVFAQDLGLLALVEGGHIVGYNFLVGGGMGMSHGNAKTFPYLAKPICHVPADRLVETAEAVVKLFRDHGNRADRKRARLKYVVHDWGVEKFRGVLSEYTHGPLALPRDMPITGNDLHLGAHAQGDGKWWYGVSVENGRVKDEGELRLRSGLRAIVERFRPELRITPNQDILLCGLASTDIPAIEAMLDAHGIPRPERVSVARSLSMACPATPTCGLAISEAERVMPEIVTELEAALASLGLQDERLNIRMTGCPNGCARPYQSDIGIVGRSGDKYVVYVGGRIAGDRLNFELRDLTPRGEIVSTLLPLLRRFREERSSGEGFGDFCTRIGPDAARATAGVHQAAHDGHCDGLARPLLVGTLTCCGPVSRPGHSGRPKVSRPEETCGPRSGKVRRPCRNSRVAGCHGHASWPWGARTLLERGRSENGRMPTQAWAWHRAALLRGVLGAMATLRGHAQRAHARRR
ncbi:MAG: NADPH-dependent assimilatory sulfite reductase hemoprotein subunit [Gemmataceae bacterium]